MGMEAAVLPAVEEVSAEVLAHRERGRLAYERKKARLALGSNGDQTKWEEDGGFKVPKAWLPLPERARREDEMEWLFANHIFLVDYDKQGHASAKKDCLLREGLQPPPSTGTLGLLRHACLNDRGFFSRIIGGRSMDAAEADNSRLEGRSIEEIKKVLEQFRKKKGPG
jgi:hypothetical protein